MLNAVKDDILRHT